MTQTPAGWYPDPESTDQQRYWDGTRWTEHRAPVQPTYQPPSYPVPTYQQPGQPGQAYGQPAAYGAYQQQGQSHTTRNVLIVIGVLFVLLVGGCFAVVGVAAKGVNDGVNEALDDARTPHDVVYRVGGTATSADVTYTDDDAASSAGETVPLPWEKKVRIAGSFVNFYSLSVTGVGEGTVTCEILVDGATVDTGTSEGSLGFASCDFSS